MRKRTWMGALLGVVGFLTPNAVHAQQQSLHVGPAVLPGVSNEAMRNMPTNKKAPTKKNTLKEVSDFLSKPIVQVATFVGVRKTETKPAYQVRREQMYQQRKLQHREEMMKARSPR